MSGSRGVRVLKSAQAKLLNKERNLLSRTPEQVLRPLGCCEYVVENENVDMYLICYGDCYVVEIY